MDTRKMSWHKSMETESSKKAEKEPPPPPFVPAKNPFTVYELMKTVINGIFLGPVKFATVWIIMFAFSPMLLVLTCGTGGRKSRNQVIDAESAETGESGVEPLTGWRWKVVKFFSFIPRVLLWILGFWVREHGRPADPTIAPIVVANHTTIFEGFFMAYRLIPCILAKAGIAKVPVIGPTLKLCRAYFFNKFDPDARTKCTNEIRRRIERGGFQQLLIFPEGTTTNGEYLIPFKRGAFSPGVTVQPAIVRYPYRFFSPSYVRGGTFWTFWNIFRTLTQFVNYMEVTWLPPYHPNEAEKADPILFANNVREYMSKASGMPTYDVRDITRDNKGTPKSSPVSAPAAPSQNRLVDNDPLSEPQGNALRLPPL